MSGHITTVTRGLRGVTALTVVPLWDNRQLRIDTSKRNRGVGTTATVVEVQPDTGTGFTGFSYVMFQDYSKTLAFDPAARATVANVERIHAQALATLPATLADIHIHYKRPASLAAIAEEAQL